MDLELEQRSTELLAIAEVDGKRVLRISLSISKEVISVLTGLVLHLTGPEIHAQLKQGICWRQDLIEKNESNDAWLLPEEAKVCEEERLSMKTENSANV